MSRLPLPDTEIGYCWCCRTYHGDDPGCNWTRLKRVFSWGFKIYLYGVGSVGYLLGIGMAIFFAILGFVMLAAIIRYLLSASSLLPV